MGKRSLTVEAGMRAGQSVLVPIITMDVEATETVHAFQLFESVQRNLAGAGDELEEFGALFFIERADRTPQPLDLRGGSGVVVVFGVVLPIVDVDVGQSGYEQLEFLFVENGYEFCRNNVVEA